MSKKVDAFMEQFNAEATTPSQAIAQLKQLDSFNQADRAQVAEHLEKWLLSGIDNAMMPPDALENAEALLKILKDLGPVGREVLAADLNEFEHGLALSKAVAKVVEIKGDKAHEKLKIFAEESAQIPEKDFDTLIGQMKLFIEFSKRLSGQPSAPKANPFRKGPGG